MSVKLTALPVLNFAFLHENYSPVLYIDFIKKACQILPTLHLEKYSIKTLVITHIDIILVPINKMTQLNITYHQKEGPTDVLSFPYDQHILGEIYICLTEVLANAKHFNNTPFNELAEVLCHSILHLLDYKHSKRMFTLQKKMSLLLLHKMNIR